MTETMPERIWIDPDLYNDKGQAICGDWSSDIMDGQCHEYVRADLARPAPAEGAVVKPLEWDERSRAQGYRVQPTYGQDRKPYILTRDGKIIWAYDTIEDAKAEAQADWERRILSAFASPEDATPAEIGERALMRSVEVVDPGFEATPAAPVSVEEARGEIEAAIKQAEEVRSDASSEEVFLEAGAEIRTYNWVLTLLAQQDRRAALREMQSIREEMEGESGHD